LISALYVQEFSASGYPQHYGKVRITGRLETEGGYGQLGAFAYQITPSRV
jgi:hypothetical protein